MDVMVVNIGISVFVLVVFVYAARMPNMFWMYMKIGFLLWILISLIVPFAALEHGDPVNLVEIICGGFIIVIGGMACLFVVTSMLMNWMDRLEARMNRENYQHHEAVESATGFVVEERTSHLFDVPKRKQMAIGGIETRCGRCGKFTEHLYARHEGKAAVGCTVCGNISEW